MLAAGDTSLIPWLALRCEDWPDCGRRANTPDFFLSAKYARNRNHKKQAKTTDIGTATAVDSSENRDMRVDPGNRDDN